MGKSATTETTKAYFAPYPRERNQRAGARQLLPTLISALRYRREDRQFIKLYKNLGRRAIVRENIAKL